VMIRSSGIGREGLHLEHGAIPDEFILASERGLRMRPSTAGAPCAVENLLKDMKQKTEAGANWPHAGPSCQCRARTGRKTSSGLLPTVP